MSNKKLYRSVLNIYDGCMYAINFALNPSLYGDFMFSLDAS